MAVTETTVKNDSEVRVPPNLDRKSCESGSRAKLLVSNGCNKRKAEFVLDGEREKRKRLDPVVKQQCRTILETLITHPTGWIFRTPVDPVALNIPDYFSIISHPMDLGTIKSKLAGNRYFSAEEFASDIKLTFSNAMLYNPPDNPVHRMAKELECVFIRRWKLLEAKWKRETACAQQDTFSSKSEKTAQNTMRAFDKKSLEQISSGLEKNAQNRAKPSCKKPQGLISNGIEKKAQDTRKAFCKNSQGIVSNESEKNAQDTKKAFCKNSQGLISGKFEKNAQCKKSDTVLVAKRSMLLEERQKLKKDLIEMLKGKVNGKLQTVLQKFGFFDIRKEKIDVNIDDLQDDILWELKRVLKDSSDASSAKESKDKMLSTQTKIQHRESKVIQDRETKTIQDCQSKTMSTHSCRVNADSVCQLTEGSGSGEDEEYTWPSSGLSTTITSAISGECWTPLIDDEQALKKALRIAKLKSRFAETISKANGDKTDAEQERERVKRLQREEELFKARIRGEQLKKEAELKRQRDKEREAARLALQLMEKAVQLEDNLMTLKELEMLTQCSPTFILHGCCPVMVLRRLETGEILNPLEQLGLHIKDDFLEEDDDEETFLTWEGEEGEILG